MPLRTPEGPTPGPLARTLPQTTWRELDRTLWRLEREKCLTALSTALERDPRLARPYLELRLWRIERALRALETILGPDRGRR